MEKYDNLCVCVCRCVVEWRAGPWRSMTTCVCVCRCVVGGGPGHGEV